MCFWNWRSVRLSEFMQKSYLFRGPGKPSAFYFNMRSDRLPIFVHQHIAFGPNEMLSHRPKDQVNWKREQQASNSKNLAPENDGEERDDRRDSHRFLIDQWNQDVGFENVNEDV